MGLGDSPWKSRFVARRIDRAQDCLEIARLWTFFWYISPHFCRTSCWHCRYKVDHVQTSFPFPCQRWASKISFTFVSFPLRMNYSFKLQLSIDLFSIYICHKISFLWAPASGKQIFVCYNLWYISANFSLMTYEVLYKIKMFVEWVWKGCFCFCRIVLK